jgi:endonuclease/exonuclease/phosphatase (EEP) superfamily protein YafD
MTRSGWNSDSAERWAARLIAGTVCAMGAGTLLGFFGRLAWLAEITGHFRVQYFWLLAASALALTVCKRGKFAAAGAALAAANLAVILPLYWGPAPSASDRPVVRIVSLNVHWRSRDYARTLQWLRAEKPDLVLLLEITPEWAEALNELEAEFPYSRSVPRLDSGGIALYSRVPLEHLQIRHLDGINLPTVIAQVQVLDRLLTVIGTHPPSPISANDFDVRNRQLAAVGRLARQQTGAVIVLGDLNTTSWSPYFRDLLADSGLADTRRGFGVLASWPNLPSPLRIPIDHCLVSHQVAVRDRRIGPAVGSDHRAVIVDLTVKDP